MSDSDYDSDQYSHPHSPSSRPLQICGSSVKSSPTTVVTPDRTQALTAALSRLAVAQSTPQTAVTPSGSSLALRTARQSFLTIIDSELVPRNPTPIALASLQTLLTVTVNILKNPEELKYKNLKLTNPLINKHIVQVPGAKDYLSACCFGPAVKEHLAYMCFPKSPSPRQLELLALGHEILKQKIASRTDAYETAQRLARKEAEEERIRRARALDSISDDRDRQRVRQQREKWAREKQAQEPEPIQRDY